MLIANRQFLVLSMQSSQEKRVISFLFPYLNSRMVGTDHQKSSQKARRLLRYCSDSPQVSGCTFLISLLLLETKCMQQASVSVFSVNLEVKAQTVTTSLLAATKVTVALRVSLQPMSTGFLKQMLVRSYMMTKSSAYLQPQTQASSIIFLMRKPPKVLPWRLRSCVCMISQVSMRVLEMGLEVSCKAADSAFLFRQMPCISWMSCREGCVRSQELSISFLRRTTFCRPSSSRNLAFPCSTSLSPQKLSPGISQPRFWFFALRAIIVKREFARSWLSCSMFISIYIEVLPTWVRQPSMVRSLAMSILSKSWSSSTEPVTQTISLLYDSPGVKLPWQWLQLTMPAIESMSSKMRPMRTSLSNSLFSFSLSLGFVASGRVMRQQEFEKQFTRGSAVAKAGSFCSVSSFVKKPGTRASISIWLAINEEGSTVKFWRDFWRRLSAFLVQQEFWETWQNHPFGRQPTKEAYLGGIWLSVLRNIAQYNSRVH